MRDELLEIELSLDLKITDEVITHDWGRVFLCPTLPLVWDLNWILVEQEGMAAAEVIAAADEALAPFNHRTVAIRAKRTGGAPSIRDNPLRQTFVRPYKSGIPGSALGSVVLFFKG